MSSPITHHLDRTMSLPPQLQNGSVSPDFASLTPPKQQSATSGIHQRTYQACIPCRQRKVRCDLGSVDNPHDPPCVRCRRESKECYFSATRRKKKDDGEEGSGDDESVYVIKSGRKRVRPTTSHGNQGANEQDDEDDLPRTPGGSIGTTQPLRRPQPPNPIYGIEDERASAQTTALLQAAEVHSGHDALKVLYAAAVHGRNGSKTGEQKPNLSGVSPASLMSATSTLTEKGHGSFTFVNKHYSADDPTWKVHIDPNMTKGGMHAESTSMNPDADIAALKAWSRFRFVRAGWFTAREAISYIEYFYQFLAPLTPVALPNFESYENHEKLITQEPMLTVTMLLIASRHMKLEGPGATSRPYSIHQKLWTYLSGMIQRVVWGQEQFGSGFCGAGAEPSSDVNPLSRKGLRTLGTVESFVLLTEWHPRAMHFPPDEADDELVVPEEPVPLPDFANDHEVPKGIGGQRMDSWLEPCWRSDRMCWMLLGMAMSLAFEIGVFDSTDWQRHARCTDGQPLGIEELQIYDQRRGNVRDILLVYVTQTSGRLGLTSMLPSNYSKPEDSSLFKRQIGPHTSTQQTVLHFWLRMAALMREGNRSIFANKAYTRNLIKSGKYKDALENLQVPLSEWRYDFDSCDNIPKYMRYILEIEYEYCRVYLNALALQAVAERCANEQPSQSPVELVGSAITTNGVRPDVAISPQTLAKWLGGDRKYMLAVGDSARNLLKVVVDDLYPGEYLRHAPVRTYFRIISVAIMLLKSFSLGATQSDVADSLSLMDRTVEALRTCIVDDVHVASRFADLLATLTESLKPRLIRIAADGRSGRSRHMSNHDSPLPPQATQLGAADHRYKQPPLQPQPQHHAMTNAAGLMYQQQSWGQYNPNFPNTSMGVAQAGIPSDPLYGISNDTYDLTDNDFSVMPPPTWVTSPGTKPMNPMTSSTGGTTFDPVYGNSHNNGYANGADDWFALPLDNMINMTSGVDVSQTMYGPQLGDQDMLELLLNANNGNNANGNGFN